MIKPGLFLAALCVLFVIAAGMCLSKYLAAARYSYKPQEARVTCPDGTVVVAQVADDDAKRTHGLGNRDVLAANAGMLFLFDVPSSPGFWMKDMKFPIDIIWINNETIVGIEANAPVWDSDVRFIYTPPSAVDRVLEVNAGFAAAHHLVVSQTVRISYD